MAECSSLKPRALPLQSETTFHPHILGSSKRLAQSAPFLQRVQEDIGERCVRLKVRRVAQTLPAAHTCCQALGPMPDTLPAGMLCSLLQPWAARHSLQQPCRASCTLLAAHSRCEGSQPGRAASLGRRVQTTVRRWDAVERSALPLEPMAECRQHLAYLRQAVPLMTGYAGLGLPEPEAHVPSPSRPSTARGAPAHPLGSAARVRGCWLPARMC